MSDEATQDGEDELLVPLDDYLSNGVHVGLKYKMADMEEFVYKTRQNKLSVFDVRKIDERIRIASEFISRYNPEDVLVISNRVYGRKSIKKFSQYTGVKAVTSRFISGTLTNPNIQSYMEPKLLIVTDPSSDQQAIKEAATMGIPVVAICDTNTRIRNIDYIIPSNNKGKNSLALIYWILTREILKRQGIEKFDAELEEFVSQAEPQPYLIKMQEIHRKQRMKRKRKR
ncbi:MAG: 30S ribosomal protein S2 [Candidatus Altiarchaeota archaeon]|nr:30S ribosomal protein S2 [Candidatus Altiarchaeota archaeon]